MTPKMHVIGFLSVLAILVIIPLYSRMEPTQQESLLEEIRDEAIVSASDHYAENCAVCHGAAGEGIAANPPLNIEGVRSMSEEDLYDVIGLGRYNTQMAAWLLDKGGIFTSTQVQDMVTLIQYADWAYVEARVADLGLTPPEVIEMEIPAEMTAALNALPDGELLSSGLNIYAENCAACHNANGSGTVIAPALDTVELRQDPAEDIREVIERGVPGTLMSGWESQLSGAEIDAVIDLILRWPEVVQTGVDFPEAENTALPSSPELIEAGSSLYRVACQSCHGVEAYGTPMAPALNNAIFLGETPDAAIYQIIAGGVPGTLMPAWGNRLTDQDIQGLVAYLRGLEDTAPPILPPIEE